MNMDNDDYVSLMEEYPYINQIYFNKRKTISYKPWRSCKLAKRTKNI